MSTSVPEPVKCASPIRVMLLEDDGRDFRRFRDLLESRSAGSFEVEHHSWEGWRDRPSETTDPDIALFGVDQLDAEQLRARVDSIRCSSSAAIIALAEDDEDDLLVRVLEAGAAGLVVRRELTAERLLNAVMSAIHGRRTIRRLEIELECAIYMANHDRITNLENRHSLERRLSLLVANVARNQRKMGVLFVEASGLKSVNDSLGHNAGNQLLLEVAQRLAGSVRLSDEVTRSYDDEAAAAISHLGGSEFTILLSEIADPQGAARVAGRILDVLSKSFTLDGQEVFVNTSIGIAVFPFDGSNADSLLRNAGSAKLEAKAAGGNSFRFYAKSMNSQAARRLKLGSLLHRALEREEFSLHYQPLRHAASSKLLAVEALLRWSTEELGDVSPAEFIPIAEDTNLIVPIGEWVLRSAALQHCRWLEAGYEPIRLAVNLSGRQLERSELPDTVGRVLRETGMSASHLELEITETTIMRHGEQMKLAFEELRGMGVGLALDDFGTGFSTLTHLSSIPVDRLKIDRSFISQIESRSQGAGIVSALIAMAHSLDLAVVAEGVETIEQANFLRQRGCDELQGFLLGRPVPATDFERFLEENKPPD